MWNLTAKHWSNSVAAWTAAAYQEEFANAAAGLNQRQPMRLPSSGCPSSATCETTVRVAGFGRACAKSQASMKTQNITVLPYFSGFAVGGRQFPCSEVGDNVRNSCVFWTIDFQLEFDLISEGISSTSAAERIKRGKGPGELPWAEPDLFPTTINYTSYFREDPGSDVLTIQRCNFTTAYVDIPIEITQTDVIQMKQLSGPELSARNRGVESIPSPNHRIQWGHLLMLAGFEQTMQDLYGGISVYDGSENNHGIQGAGPRQFIKPDTAPIKESFTNLTRGFRLSFSDPLEAFTDGLHELSLRYALETITSTPERQEEMEDFFVDEDSRDPDLDSYDVRSRALQAMTTKPGPSQRVPVHQTSMIAVYRSNPGFAIVAVAISTAVSVLVGLLFSGWRSLGRQFSMSPLEIARAFDAPLLRDVGSNTTADEMAKGQDMVDVKYGERGQRGTDPRAEAEAETDVRPSAPLEADGKRALRAETESLMEPAGSRLIIDLADHVVLPVKGKTYI